MTAVKRGVGLAGPYIYIYIYIYIYFSSACNELLDKNQYICFIEIFITDSSDLSIYIFSSHSIYLHGLGRISFKSGEPE